MKYILIGMLGFLSLPSTALYYYCVGQDNTGIEINPQSIIQTATEGKYLTKGETITLGGGSSLVKYKIDEKDLLGGKFSSTWGLATPYVYFIYNETYKEQMLPIVNNLIEQCNKLLTAQGFSQKTFKELRVSDSVFSGTNFVKAGYPAVFLRLPTKEKTQNIFRIEAGLKDRIE